MMVVSTIIMAMGISMVALSDLGASAVTSLAYVLSLIFTVSFGTMTFIFNVIYIVLQKLIMKENFPTIQWGQIVVSLFLGLAIDAWTLVLQPLQPQNYIVQLLVLIIGCLVIAFSTILQITYSPIYNPAEGIVTALSKRFDLDFSKMKVTFDTSLVFLAAVISLFYFGYLNGVREGTVISSFLVGWLINVLKRLKGDR